MKNAIVRGASAGLLLAVAAPAAAAGASETRLADESRPLSDADLGAYRAGATIVAGNQSLKAITSGNVFNGDYVAGSITLSDNALSNFNGLGNFAINTGAQVSLQSGLNLIINVGQ